MPNVKISKLNNLKENEINLFISDSIGLSYNERNVNTTDITTNTYEKLNLKYDPYEKLTLKYDRNKKLNLLIILRKMKRKN